jgi:hypothetical protein
MTNALKFDDNAIIPSTVGRLRFKGLDVNFTSATEVNKTYTFGEQVIDAVTNNPVRLPGRPTFDALTATTPFTIGAQKKILTWLKTVDASPTNVACTLILGNLVYTFTKCSLSQSPISPNVDANANQTTSNFLTLVVEITNNSLIDIK